MNIEYNNDNNEYQVIGDYYLYTFRCFNRTIKVKLYKKTSNLIVFWLERFCPNVELIKSEVNDYEPDLVIEFINSNKYNYCKKQNIYKLYGKIDTNESYIAKFITQCFQKLLINDGILIIPAACVSTGNAALLILGDFWQGKTSLALNMKKKYNYDILSDNYVAIKKDVVIGTSKFISIRKEDIDLDMENSSLYNINDRYFYSNSCCSMLNKKICGFLIPYISNGNNTHIISKEESIWYLYQKFTRLLCGETILFDGNLSSPVFLNKHSSTIILGIVKHLLENSKIVYSSSELNNISDVGSTILMGGEIHA